MSFNANGLLSLKPAEPPNITLGFASNGLLGASSNTAQVGESNSATISTLVGEFGEPSGGLLGAPSRNEPTANSFSENGLLSGTATVFSSSETGPSSLLSDTSEQVKIQPKPANLYDNASHQESFMGNGLLSVPSDSRPAEDCATFIPTTLLSDSQDETLPEVSDLLRPYANDSIRAPETLSMHLYRRPVRATTYEGRTLYMKRKTRVELGVQLNSARTSAGQIGNLLDVPIHRLMDELSAATAARLSKPALPQAAPSNIAPEDTLWVDRYRPKHFADILGNERAARDALTWVKTWDWCVFGKRKGSKKRAREGDDDRWVEDEFHRPREKLLLLSGPPGLGKTTLAHVVARQAGYQVMEINASDARTGQVIDDRVRPALESGSAVGSTKPVLVVIDEIDGATGGGENTSGFVQKLVQLTQDRPRKKKRSNGSRDPSDKRPLLRPIICICNDAYAAALGKLRPHALHIRVARPADAHIVKRLREVCAGEGLEAESRALTTLVGVARGDLRGCLNTLQFVKARGEEVTESIIRAATVGMKEADSSVTSVLNSLFAPMTRKRAKELGIGEEQEARYVGRLSREVEGSDQSSKVALGCFGHYANLRQQDATFARYEKANEWLVTFDRLESAMYTGEFGAVAYLPYMLVPFYPLFQERGGARVERNQVDWDNHVATRTNEEIYKALAHGLRVASGRQAGDYRHLACGDVLQLEFAPLINRIISPPLRPVNSQVIKPEERALLARLVSIMVALELRFVQEKAEDGQLVYRLDPPVDVFVTYDGKRAADIAISRYAVRHLVAAEIDAELIQRQADAVEKGKSRKLEHFSKSFKKPEDDEPADEVAEGKELPDAAGAGPPAKRPKKDMTDIADKPPTDFFGRPITVPSASTTKAAVRKNVEKKYRVTYRFVEGNSAAVRKPVKMGAFL